MTDQTPDPRLAWITQALNDAAQTLPPAARAAYVAQANRELQVIAGALHAGALHAGAQAGSHADTQAFVPAKPSLPVAEQD